MLINEQASEIMNKSIKDICYIKDHEKHLIYMLKSLWKGKALKADATKEPQSIVNPSAQHVAALEPNQNAERINRY